jgi:hypothetical protein
MESVVRDHVPCIAVSELAVTYGRTVVWGARWVSAIVAVDIILKSGEIKQGSVVVVEVLGLGEIQIVLVNVGKTMELGTSRVHDVASAHSAMKKGMLR